MTDFDVRTSFISVVDHLPADIIRKLWLIQSLDISYTTQYHKLNQLLKADELNLKEITNLQTSLLNLRKESLEESKSIISIIKLTNLQLLNQFNQLKYDEKLLKSYNNGKSENQVQEGTRDNKRLNSKPKLVIKPKKHKQHKHRVGMKSEREPKYCLCNGVSYGDMVACDNPKCPREWFHYDCVGLTRAPAGKWYCPECR